jgi:hypothetical protein
MLRLQTSVDIKTSPERVWSVLMDFRRYAAWNPFIRSLEGEPRVGAVLNAFLQPPRSYGMRFRPRVVTLVPQREFRWRGTLLWSRLFQGDHFFFLEPVSPQLTRLFHGEIFTGLLVPLLRRQLLGPTQRGFHAMNEALKGESEQL